MSTWTVMPGRMPEQTRTLLGHGDGSESIALWVMSAERPAPADESFSDLNRTTIDK